jgi:hypothetical protein
VIATIDSIRWRRGYQIGAAGANLQCAVSSDVRKNQNQIIIKAGSIFFSRYA